MLVRTRADADTVQARSNDTTMRDAALAGGAQFVSTDYEVPDPRFGPYVVRIPGGTPARCNPVTAPPGCRSTDVENPKLLDGVAVTRSSDRARPAAVMRRCATARHAASDRRRCAFARRVTEIRAAQRWKLVRARHIAQADRGVTRP